MNREECPNVAKHTRCPEGYGPHAEWVKKKGRRHKQVRCPICSLWKIWIRRAANELDYGGDPAAWGVEPSKEES